MSIQFWLKTRRDKDGGAGGHLPGDLSVSPAAPTRCGSVDEVVGASASGSCTAGGRGHGPGARWHGQHRQG
jgi:hypothetical protein